MHVQLPQFEGPLGLLLFLIRKDEVDIYNIPIHTITQQYLEHIKKMRELDLEVAGDFIAMAATLIHIKSRMLLPQYDENGEPIEVTDDPRKELVQKLVEYQRYQEASKTLNQRALLGRDVWARGLKEELPMDEGDIIVDEGGLFSLISMYRKVVRQLAKSVHNVRAKGQSIAARVLEIRDRLVVGRRIVMSELILVGEKSASKVLITFLSLLELTKMGFTNIFQADTYGEIYIDTLKIIERDVIERVEEYDKKPEEAAALAAALEGESLATQFHAVELGKDDLDENSDAQLSLADQTAPLAEELAPTEELASNDEIMAAELEMGFDESEIELDAVDKALANFSLDVVPENSLLVVSAQETLSEVSTEIVTETTVESVEEESLAAEPEVALVETVDAESPPLINDEDFESAWAKFEDDSHGIAIDLEAQALGSEALVSEDEIEDFAVADINHIFKKPTEPESEI